MTNSGTTPFCAWVAGRIMVGNNSSPNARMDDKTERTRVRESVAQHKLALTIFALLAVVGIIGWLTSL